MLTKLVAIGVLGYLLYKGGSFLIGTALKGRFNPDTISRPESRSVTDEMVQDPVCGVFVVKGQAVTSTYRGVKVYFCSEACRKRFEQEQV